MMNKMNKSIVRGSIIGIGLLALIWSTNAVFAADGTGQAGAALTTDISVESLTNKIQQTEDRCSITSARMEVIEQTAERCGISSSSNTLLRSAQENMNNANNALASTRSLFKRALNQFEAGNGDLAMRELSKADNYLGEASHYLDNIDIFLNEFLGKYLPEDVSDSVIEAKKEEASRFISQARDSVNSTLLQVFPLTSLERARRFLSIAEEYYLDSTSFASLEAAKQGALMSIEEVTGLGRRIFLSAFGVIFLGCVIFFGLFRRDIVLNLLWSLKARRPVLR